VLLASAQTSATIMSSRWFGHVLFTAMILTARLSTVKLSAPAVTEGSLLKQWREEPTE